MPRTNIFDMPFPKVYGALVNKAEKKGRTKAEVDEITRWLTGYSDLEELDGKTYGEFIEGAPSWNPHAELITGKICGVQVETIEDPAMKKVRQLDKLVDELAKGKPIEKVNYPPPTHTLRGGGFVPLTRTQGRHLPAVPFHRDYFCDSSDPHSGYLYESWLSLCHTGTRSPSPPDRYSRYTSCRY